MLNLFYRWVLLFEGEFIELIYVGDVYGFYFIWNFSDELLNVISKIVNKDKASLAIVLFLQIKPKFKMILQAI